MKRLILIMCLVLLLMIAIANINDITELIIEQYNIIIQETHNDINKAFNSLIGVN